MSLRWDGAGPGHHVERRRWDRDTWEAVMENRENPDPLYVPEDEPADDIGRPGMLIVFGALAMAAAALIVAYLLVTR